MQTVDPTAENPTTQGPAAHDPAAGDAEPMRSVKDALATRAALVQAARRRFASEGYRSATVRNIAADAGVNVALINRYFGSKEGLFEACLERTAEGLRPAEAMATQPGHDARPGLDQVIDGMISHMVSPTDPAAPLQLLLLLRSSGDQKADEIRTRILQTYTQTIAEAAGLRVDDPATQDLLLRAQLAMATGLGVIMLRSSTGIWPLSGISAKELAIPVRQVLRALLQPA